MAIVRKTISIFVGAISNVQLKHAEVCSKEKVKRSLSQNRYFRLIPRRLHFLPGENKKKKMNVYFRFAESVRHFECRMLFFLSAYHHFHPFTRQPPNGVHLEKKRVGECGI